VTTAGSGPTAAVAAATPASHVSVVRVWFGVSQMTCGSAAPGEAEGAGEDDSGADGVAAGVATALGVASPGGDGVAGEGSGAAHAADSSRRIATIPMIRFT
jgi:hypothetical protein